MISKPLLQKLTGIAGLVVLLVLAASAPKEDHKTLEIGASAPDFSLPGIDGKQYSLKSFAGSPALVVVFSCNHCPTAQAYEDRLIRMVSDYKPRQVNFVVISPNNPTTVSLAELGYTDLSDSFEEMKIRAKAKGYNFPYLYDGDTQATALKYGPVATPHVFIFDKNRRLQYAGRFDAKEKPGTGNAEDARAALDAVLAGQKVPVPTTKTFGCSVKWLEKDDYIKKQQAEWAKQPVSLEDVDVAGLKKLIQNDSDKLRLINVWATWCGPCVQEFPDFISIDRMYRERDFEFVSVSADKPDKKAKALEFLKKKEASNKNYIFNSDDKYALIEAIDPKWQGALPYTILVEPGGKIVYSKQGAIDVLEMKRRIVENRLIGRYY
ncbi:redoxin family protein [Larkinella insperata]|uniref:Redoxin family protein n=1 Tax=Larkinella insperata TaxID=332158 RepID=A0ABW3QEY2_9BACT|nr:redoxin family protein [Larkinella insperata]